MLEKTNEDYRLSIEMHNADQDLTWWDQNYGESKIGSHTDEIRLIICISLIGTQTNNRWPEFEEYRD
jgi:hypothetical protein